MSDSIPDVSRLRSIDELRKIKSRAYPSSIDGVMKAYVILGLMIAAASLSYFAVSFLKITLSNEQIIALTSAGSGLAVSTMSAAYLAIRRDRSARELVSLDSIALDYDLIKEWIRFEAMGKKILQKYGIDFNSRSPRSILSALQSVDIVPIDLGNEISVALDIRNKVVHDIDPVPEPIVRAAARILADSNERLSKLLDEKQSDF